MRDESKDAFESVVKNAEVLKNYSFKENIKNIQMVWTWHKDKPEDLAIKGPNSEQVAAFLLTFRKFIQEKDQCSFKYLANNTLDDPGISEEWKKEFTKLRNELNNFLDASPSWMPIQFGNEPVANQREILRTYIYGMYAHENPDKKAVLEKWREKVKVMQGVFDTQFLRIVVGVFGAIVVLGRLCEKELKNQKI